MPLLNRKPYTPQPPSASIRDNDEVFVVRFTGEMFRDYAQYLKTIKLYQQRSWSCSITGKTQLT
jgi:hypothetical protein